MKKNYSSWYAVYTKPFWEKKISLLLESVGVISYCPMQKIQRQWSDRKKIIYTPLFKSYVFINISENQKTLVKQITGVINFVNYLGRPAVIRDQEIDAIKKFHNDYEHIEVRKAELETNSRAKIIGGGLSNLQSNIAEVLQKVELYLPAFGYTLSAKLSKTNSRKELPHIVAAPYSESMN